MKTMGLLLTCILSAQANEKSLTEFLVSSNYSLLIVPESCFESGRIYCDEYRVGSSLFKQTWIFTPHEWHATKIISNNHSEDVQADLIVNPCAHHATLILTTPLVQQQLRLICNRVEQELCAAGITQICCDASDDQWSMLAAEGFVLDDQFKALPLCKKIKKQLVVTSKNTASAISKYQESNLKNVLAGLYNYPHTQS